MTGRLDDLRMVDGAEDHWAWERIPGRGRGRREEGSDVGGVFWHEVSGRIILSLTKKGVLVVWG